MGGDIETLWQRPPVQPKGIFFIAHGCHHQAPDIFSEVGQDGWVFEACRKSYFGRCLGLPEEVRLRRAALQRGYVVMAVSGGVGKQSCWFGKDVERVIEAVRHVKKAEHLQADAPVLASGASSGGSLMGLLALPNQLPNLTCIVPQVADVHTLTWGSMERKIPTLFVEMDIDGFTLDGIDDDLIALRAKGVRAAKIKVHPHEVTPAFLEDCLSPELARRVVEALKKHSVLDNEGYLKEDSRSGAWVKPIQPIIEGRSNDTLVPDESCISEKMNVAWAFHEFTGEFAEDMLDFCEEKGKYASDGSRKNS